MVVLPDIEVGLSDEELAVRDSVRRFASEVMRPVGARLDRLQDPQQVIDADSELWTVFEQYRALGVSYDDMAQAEQEGTDILQRVRMRYLINEEMGWGDSGLAISLGVADFHKFFCRLSGNPALLDRYCGPRAREVGCWAITEPSHGSDSLHMDPSHYQPPGRKPDCIAELDGSHYILNGQKSAWVSNGSIAQVAVLFVAIHEGGSHKGGGVAVVPLDGTGVSKGKPLDKVGQRALNQGEIFFDNVRVPAEYMLVGTDAYGAVLEMVLTAANASMGCTFVGLARAALEHAIEYARERVQGGRALIEHQSVQARLFKMFAKVEAARSLARRATLFNSTQEPLVQYSIASKVTATNTAFEVASEALQILGGNGLTREYPTEKLMRDARASMIEDGCNEFLGLVGAGKL